MVVRLVPTSTVVVEAAPPTMEARRFVSLLSTKNDATVVFTGSDVGSGTLIGAGVSSLMVVALTTTGVRLLFFSIVS